MICENRRRCTRFGFSELFVEEFVDEERVFQERSNAHLVLQALLNWEARRNLFLEGSRQTWSFFRRTAPTQLDAVARAWRVACADVLARFDLHEYNLGVYDRRETTCGLM
jgi:hypothetical protein